MSKESAASGALHVTMEFLPTDNHIELN